MLMEKTCQLLSNVSHSKVSVKKCASNTEKIIDKKQKDFREKKVHSFKSTKLEGCWGVTLVLYCRRLRQIDRMSSSWSPCSIITACTCFSSLWLFLLSDHLMSGSMLGLHNISVFYTWTKKVMSKSVLRLWHAIIRRTFFSFHFFSSSSWSSYF